MVVHMRAGAGIPAPPTAKYCSQCKKVYVFVNIPIKYCPDCGSKVGKIKVA